ncbi:hypothetical protein TKK_0005228 [Trichogramma kaykai]
MMESREDAVRVKEEPYHTWPDAGDDDNFDSTDYCDVNKFETLPFHELSIKHENRTVALQEKLDEKIFIDVECKYVKPELPSLSTNNCKAEDQSYVSTVKIENPIQTNYSREKIPIISKRKGFDYNNNCQFCVKIQGKLRLKLKGSEKEKPFAKRTHTNLTHNYNLCLKTCKG